MRSVTVLGMAALLCLAVTAQADVITNGDFETGDFTGWTIVLTENGNTTTQDVFSYDIDGGGSHPESLAARFAVGKMDYYQEPDGGVVMSQEVYLVGGVEYAFDADIAAYRHSAQGNADGGTFQMTLDGAVLDSWSAGGIGGDYPWDKYDHLSGTFTPGSSDTYEIGMQITRHYECPGDVYQLVDNFTGIPEPATLALLAFGGLAALRRR